MKPSARIGRQNAQWSTLAVFLAIVLGLVLPLAPLGVPSVHAAETNYLHAATVVLGSTTYATATTSSPVGTLAEASAGINQSTWQTFVYSSANTWASDPTPSGSTWTLTGLWSFTVHVRQTQSQRADVNLRALIYKIDTNNVATLLATTGQSAQVRPLNTYTGGGSPNPVTWTYTLGSNVLNAGERWGVRFQALADRTESAQSFYLGFDSSGQNSSVAIPNAKPPSSTATPTATATATPTSTSTPTATSTSTATDTATATATATASGTPTSTATSTATAIYSPTPTNTPLYSATPTNTPTNSPTATPTSTSTATATLTATPTFSPTLTSTASPTITPTSGPIVGSPTPTAQSPAHNNSQPYSSDTYACAGCHRAHASRAPSALQASWPEEMTCYVCHDGSGAPNIKAQFDKAYKMPITAKAGAHSLSEARTKDPASFTGLNRHVECTDCHNPHSAGRVTHTNGTNYAAGPQQGMWGVAVTNTAPWTAPTYTTVTQVTHEYQICFKCHSSWTYGTNPPQSPSGGFTQTNQPKEFNTLNPSYHPVEAPGKNPFTGANGSYASSLINGFNPGSTMFCSDCHRSETPTQVKGPHGSTSPFILQGNWDRTTGQNPGNQGRASTASHVCFKCHDYDRYTNFEANRNNPWQTGFSQNGGENLHVRHVGNGRNKRNNDNPIVCMDCHVAIPHGWQRDHLLGFDGDGAPYINRPGGLVQIDSWATSGNWDRPNCETAMNGCR